MEELLVEAAALLGLQPADIVKTLVVKRADDSYLFALIPGDLAISWPKLRAVVGVNKLRLPEPELALAATGYERGTITPIGSSTDWPVYADASITGRRIAMGAGAFLLGLSFLLQPTATRIVDALLFVFVEHAFDVCDRVSVEGAETLVVRAIEVFATAFVRTDGALMYAPNSVLRTRALHNRDRDASSADAVVATAPASSVTVGALDDLAAARATAAGTRGKPRAPEGAARDDAAADPRRHLPRQRRGPRHG